MSPSLPAWRVAVRPTLLFVTAYMLTMTSHEIIHAVTAYLLGFASTVFHLWVTPDNADATHRQVAIIAASGPIGSLAIGAIAWIGYKRRPDSRFALMALLVAIIATYSFLGPLVGAAFGGDANTVLRALHAPAAARYVVSAVGAIALPAFMFVSGKALVQAAPANASRAQAAVAMVLAPWIVGTLLSVVLYLPLPPPLVVSTLAGSAFWLFAVVGAALTSEGPRRASASSLPVRSMDMGFALAALLAVRVLVNGIRLEP